MCRQYPLDLTVSELAERVSALRHAAHDSRPISGSTHGFYQYPARFSPAFAAAAIEAFSKPDALVLDPFMGGGTAIVEAMRLGRRAVGSDINALSVFVARVKTMRLRRSQTAALEIWADETIPSLRYSDPLADDESFTTQTRNLHLPHARPIKKLTALALESLSELPDAATRRFARCALLRAGQWALNGRRRRVDCAQFRERLQTSVHAMLTDIAEHSRRMAESQWHAPTLIQCAAKNIHTAREFGAGEKADLVVTSPPYPGIHILYHRWQVDGRKETPAPYWISSTRDGQGSAYYNLGGRSDRESNDYFEQLGASLSSIRSAMKDGAVIVQMVAFSNPQRDLRRYISSMREARFTEFPLSALSPDGRHRRLWRSVPHRAWHAAMKGATASSREAVFLHTAS